MFISLIDISHMSLQEYQQKTLLINVFMRGYGHLASDNKYVIKVMLMYKLYTLVMPKSVF
jgi:hypothetical protein